MARLATAFQVTAFHELLAAAVKICLQEVRGGQEAGGNHEAEGRNGERPKMEERDHRWQSVAPSKVYTRVRSHSNFPLIRTPLPPPYGISPSILFPLHLRVRSRNPSPTQMPNALHPAVKS